MEETVTKPLHVSGLTPAITVDDISRRLGSFGSVSALDGLGKLDALGQPRKFAYVTLETTQTKLAKCMNLLNGATWKGAKLRIGEARPDYRQRIARENETSEDPPRKRARVSRGVNGKLAQDMSLITKDNVHLHPQWHVTPLGRLIRPVRIRPDHPLDPPLESSKTKPKTKVGKDGKPMKARERKRKREPPTRARRRTIDPTKYGSTHLQGVFLDGGTTSSSIGMNPASSTGHGAPEESGDNDSNDGSSPEEEVRHASEGEESERETEEVQSKSPVKGTTVTESATILSTGPSPPARAPSQAFAPTLTLPKPRVVSSLAPDAAGLAEERSRTLGLLQSMFGDAEDDWGGAESASDIDLDALGAQRDGGMEEDDMEVEMVPKEKPTVILPYVNDDDKSDEASESSEDAAVPEKEEAAQAAPQKSSAATRLKDLFAPREEDAGFSLLGHLDLDLELDEPILPLPAAPPPAAPLASSYQPSFLPPSTGLDPTLPLFFPRRVDETWRQTFVRTADEAQIRARWEAARGELTGEWKRRHREAVKSRRRRGGENE